MLGRKEDTREELDHCRVVVDQQLAVYKTLRLSAEESARLSAAFFAEIERKFL
jgi:hypothetical protein